MKKAPPPPQPQAGQNQTRYLTLAGVNPSQTPQEARRAASQASSSAAISLHARKKALQISGAQVIKGADALLQKSKVDFHDELLLLRQHYRLRRSGDKILGDISFRTCGSMYNAPSQFEVIRDTENAEAPLRIRLPPELKSTTWMTIKVVECDAGSAMDSGKIKSYAETQNFGIIFANFVSEGAETALSTYQYVIHSNTKHARPYLADLKRAQDSLFCQELFSQLCREAATFR